MRVQSLNRQLMDVGVLGREMNAALPYRETVERVLSRSRAFLHADFVALLLLDAEARAFSLEGAQGVLTPTLSAECCAFTPDCPVRQAIASGELARVHGPHLHAVPAHHDPPARHPGQGGERRRHGAARHVDQRRVRRAAHRRHPERSPEPRAERPHQRPQVRRHPPPGGHRPPHAALQPALLHEPRRRGDRAQPAPPGAAERAHDRHRPLQGLQRHLRARDRRPRAADGRAGHEGRPAHARHLRAPRRRGVRRAAAQHAGRQRLLRGRARAPHARRHALHRPRAARPRSTSRSASASPPARATPPCSTSSWSSPTRRSTRPRPRAATWSCCGAPRSAQRVRS